MFLFKKNHIVLIKRGLKTQTRRLHTRARARIGAIHQCRTTLFGKAECLIKILKVGQERLDKISADDAYAEGGYTPEAYISLMKDIHDKGRITDKSRLFVYEFELVIE